jgi:hypothetical protein
MTATFCVNVESNDKQMFFTHHNKMELQNEPMGPSWNVIETWFVHKDLTWSFGPRRWTWRFTSRINAQWKLLSQSPHKKHGLVKSPMHLIWEFSIAKHMWRNPELLVRLKMNLSWSNNRKCWEPGVHSLTRNTKRGRGACWNFGMGLGRMTSLTYLLELASNQPTSWLVHFLEHLWC